MYLTKNVHNYNKEAFLKRNNTLNIVYNITNLPISFFKKTNEKCYLLKI